MSSIGERLREVRQQSGLSQTAFGAVGGVLKQAQMKYEGDKRQPDGAYLRALSEAGYDVTYIITGYHAAEIVTQRQFLAENEEAFAHTKTTLARMNITPNARIESAIVGFKQLGEAADGPLRNLYRGLAEDQADHGVRCTTPAEAQLVGDYRRADERGRQVILDTASALADRQPDPAKK